MNFRKELSVNVACNTQPPNLMQTKWHITRVKNLRGSSAMRFCSQSITGVMTYVESASVFVLLLKAIRIDRRIFGREDSCNSNIGLF